MNGSTATVAVQVAAPPDVTFDLFTREIDAWWRRGMKFPRHGGMHGAIAIEPFVGGRVYEAWHDDAGAQQFELGRVLACQPGANLRFTWRNRTFAPHEQTEVDVQFTAVGNGTLVTVRHMGWQTLPDDHPSMHGQERAAFAKSLGLWWGEQLSKLREFAASR